MFRVLITLCVILIPVRILAEWSQGGVLTPRSRISDMNEEEEDEEEEEVKPQPKPQRKPLPRRPVAPVQPRVSPQTSQDFLGDDFPSTPPSRQSIESSPSKGTEKSPLKSPLRRTRRRPASTGQRSVSTSRIKYKSSVKYVPFGTRYWVGLTGGFGTLSSGDANTQDVRNTGELTKNTMFGLNADFRLHTYYGFEADAYYGLATSQTLVDVVPGTEDKTSLAHMGGLIHGKFQYPIVAGNFLIVPKIGVGFAYLSLANKIERTDGAGAETHDTKQIMNGVYAIGGVDFEATKDLTISLDYIKSVIANGGHDEQGAGTTKLESVNFDRIRAGLYYRAFDSFIIGGQYVKRGFNTATTVSAGFPYGVSANESLSQILAVIFYEL